jgi:tRNA-dihydrouridine synthase B
MPVDKPDQPVKKISVRGLVIDPPLLLAPMEGLTHSAYRCVASGYGGVGLLATEMLSAKRLPHDNPRVSPYLFRTEQERPLSYQLLIARPEEMPAAVDALHALHADAIDLNMGCPSPKVNKIGGGIQLMDQPDTARRIVSEARRRTGLPISAKIRLNREGDERLLLDFCSLLEQEGVDLLTVHARYKHESFARNPRWARISEIKSRLRIPVIANGGIFSEQDALDCLRLSGADGLMLGRGAIIKPWLFASIARTVFGADLPEPVVLLPSLYAEFVRNLNESFRPEYRLGRLKQFTPYFARNFQFGHLLASAVQSSSSVTEAQERAEVFFRRQQSLPDSVAGLEIETRT